MKILKTVGTFCEGWFVRSLNPDNEEGMDEEGCAKGG